MRVTRNTSLLAVLVIFPLVLGGCGLNKTHESAIKPEPDKVKYIKQGDKLNSNSDEKSSAADESKTGAVSRQLYLLDANGRVTPQVVKLPKKSNEAKQVLEYLVQDGPVSNILPNGFQAVIPPGTTINSTQAKKDGTFVVDFSKEFLDYKASEEKSILQAITWTLTQFDYIKRVQIKINGKMEKVMPVGKTEIGKGLSRADGINSEIGDVVDVAASNSVTIYYLSEHEGHTYYVPVTTRVEPGENKVTAAVNALIDGPDGKGLMSPFGSDVALKGRPVIKDGVVTLDFNSALYTDKNKKTVDDDAIDCLALTLTSQAGIDKVKIEVNGSSKVIKESGQKITKPVSRPEVNKTGV
ncbi:germination protein M [Scopulibacillus daqui]|uniref:Germination protein M n=1 Tax=Scopulibacillus daqui TaxID=1469162 RepID=A0ABS2PXJ9_9BACL|nr:GerMN domain-containing protein [Scopulibacillus daqui]MBM7644747.1 germination protein M [Scopulibacillus daqui]